MKAFSFRKLNSYQLKLHFFMAKEVRKKNFNYMQFSVVAMCFGDHILLYHISCFPSDVSWQGIKYY